MHREVTKVTKKTAHVAKKFAPLLHLHLFVACDAVHALDLQLRDGVDNQGLELMLTCLKPLVSLENRVVVTNRNHAGVPSSISNRRLLPQRVPVLDDDREESVSTLNVKHEPRIGSSDGEGGLTYL